MKRITNLDLKNGCFILESGRGVMKGTVSIHRLYDVPKKLNNGEEFIKTKKFVAPHRSWDNTMSGSIRLKYLLEKRKSHISYK